MSVTLARSRSPLFPSNLSVEQMGELMLSELLKELMNVFTSDKLFASFEVSVEVVEGAIRQVEVADGQVEVAVGQVGNAIIGLLE